MRDIGIFRPVRPVTINFIDLAIFVTIGIPVVAAATGAVVVRTSGKIVAVVVNSASTIFPHSLSFDFDNSSARVIVIAIYIDFIITKTKESRTGLGVRLKTVDSIVASDINEKSKAFPRFGHRGIVDAQGCFVCFSGIYRAVVEIDDYIIFPGVKVGIYIDNLTACIESAVIKCHFRGTVCPNGIIARGRIKGGIFEHGALITPIGSSTFNNAIFNDRNISVRKSQIVLIVRNAEFHLFKSDALTALETIVTVVFATFTLILFCADSPNCFVRTLPGKGQNLIFCCVSAVDVIQAVSTYVKILVLNAKEALHLFRIIFYRKRGAEVREYRYLTHDDRLLIEKLYAHGITPSSIAGVVGVSLATIYRELPRGYTGKRYPGGRKVYSAEKAQQTTNQNIKRRGRTPADRKDATK